MLVAACGVQTLQCCNLAPAYANLLTTNHLETNIHAVRDHLTYITVILISQPDALTSFVLHVYCMLVQQCATALQKGC